MKVISLRNLDHKFSYTLKVNFKEILTTVDITKKITVAGLIILLSAVGSSSLRAQVSDYERLALRNDQPSFFLDMITLPGEKPETVKMTSIFRISYPFLAFKKAENRTKGSFSSIASLNLEVFESPRNDLRNLKQVEVAELKSVGRASWQDTVYASTYDQTQSNNKAVTGSMQVPVTPGYYTYMLQLKINEEESGRNSRTRNVRIFPYRNQVNGDIILINTVDTLQNPSTLTLMNMGDNVDFGKDFYALIHLPEYTPGTRYSYQVDRLDREKTLEFERDRRVSSTPWEASDKEGREQRVVQTLTQQRIPSDKIYTNIHPELISSGEKLGLQLSKSGDGYAYALVKIPNASYPNAFYQIQVTAEGSPQPVAHRYFQSYWADIPTSLLSLEVAIDMLRFIADEQTIDRIDSGSDREREQKFRDFWEQKDPTPQTAYNELQAEYYRRIDYAYDEFSSDRQLGFNSDRGKIYIRYGEPKNIDRVFPPDAPTREIWTYPSGKFVFEATTGFGDFKLLSN